MRICRFGSPPLTFSGSAPAPQSSRQRQPASPLLDHPYIEYPHVKRPNLVVFDIERSLTIYRDILGRT